MTTTTTTGRPAVDADGTRLLAKLDHAEGIVVHSADFTQDFHPFLENTECALCHTSRARTYTILVGLGSEILQVGTNCARKIIPPDFNLEIAFSTQKEREAAASSAPKTYKLAEVIAKTNAIIREHGWVPSQTLDAMPTYARLVGDSETDVTPADRAKAAQVIAWITNLDAGGDYEHNLRSLATSEGFLGKYMPIAASAVRAYDAAQARALENEGAEPVPTTDARIVITGTVLKVDVKEGFEYGSTRTVLTVQDDRGFKVWGTQPSALDAVAPNDRITFTAKVNASDRDEFFGFYSRPTKAKTL